MPRRRAETPSIPLSDVPLQEHLAAVEALEASKAKRQQELRPAPSALSPDPIIDPLLGDSVFNREKAVPRGRKPVVSTKRAAQNRSAQQAFRQRKDGHIRQLEDQVNHLKTFETLHKDVEAQMQVLQLKYNETCDYLLEILALASEANLRLPIPPMGLDLDEIRRESKSREDKAARIPDVETSQLRVSSTAPLGLIQPLSRSLLEDTDEADDQPMVTYEIRSEAEFPRQYGPINNQPVIAEQKPILESNIEPSFLAQSRT